MLRYSKGHWEETHRRIVDTAGRLFQEKGVDGVGVDEIMRESGLTHGGFYAHFRNKEQLIAEACARAVEVKSAEWRDRLKGLAPAEAYEAFVSAYLDCTSQPECPIAMLGGDVARRSEEVRVAYTERVRELVDFMTEELGCGREEAVLTFAALTGAANVSQASGDQAFAREILETTRRELLRLSAERCGQASAPRRRAAAV